MAFNVVVGIFYTPFMISKLGDGQYGIYSLANSLISFVTLLDLGFGQTLVRYISKERAIGNKKEEYKLNGFFLKLYCIIAAIALIVGILIIVLYPRLATKTFSIQEIYLFRVVFLILLVNVVISFPMSVFSATLNAYEEYTFLKLINLVFSILKYISMFFLLLYGYKLIGIAIVILISSLGMQFSYLFYSVKKLKIKFDFSACETKLAREIFLFSFFIFLNLIIDFLYSNTDKLILGVVAGTVSVSIYSIGIYFSQYFTELSSAMSGVFMPKIMSLYQNQEKREISDLFNRVGRLQMAILFLALGGYTCLGEEFINLWVGNTYKDSYIIGIIIMIPSIVPLTQNIGITIIRAMNIHKYRSYMYIIIAILNVIISIPLAIRFGGIGSAIGTSIGTILGQIIFMNLFYSKKVEIDIKQYWINFVKFLSMTFVVCIVVFFIKHFFAVSTWGKFMMTVFVFIFVYGILYWKIVSNEYERKNILKILKRI